MRVTDPNSPRSLDPGYESDPDVEPDVSTTTRHTGRHDPTYVIGDQEPLNDDEEEYEEVVIVKRRRKKRDVESKNDMDHKHPHNNNNTPTTTTPTISNATVTLSPNQTSATSSSSSSSSTPAVPGAAVVRATTPSSARAPVAAPIPVAAAAPAPAAADDVPFESTYRYVFLRFTLILLLFLLFQHLYDTYYWIPNYRPHEDPTHQKHIQQQVRDKLNQQMCPPGATCEYQLPDDYELNWKHGAHEMRAPKQAIHDNEPFPVDDHEETEDSVSAAEMAELEHEIKKWQKKQDKEQKKHDKKQRKREQKQRQQQQRKQQTEKQREHAKREQKKHRHQHHSHHHYHDDL